MLNKKKILIENWGGLGDLIMFTPTLRRIKEKFPECKITFLTREENLMIVKELPYVDRACSIQRKKFMGRYRCLPVFFNQDIVIFTTWQPQLAFIAYLLRIKKRVSIYREKYSNTKLFNQYFKSWIGDTHDYAATIIARNFSSVLEIELHADISRLDVPYPNLQTREKINFLMQKIGLKNDSDFIIIPPFTSSLEKDWPLVSLNEFILTVKEKWNLPCVIIGPKSRIEESKKILSSYNLVGKTSLEELIELIRKSKLFVGPDSGPMHIAGALGIPSVILFSRFLPSQWAPKRNCIPISTKLPCCPCSDEDSRRCKDFKCIRSISVNMVLCEVEKFLN